MSPGVLRDPQAAEDNQILATPTLIRRSPLPERRLLGDLSPTQTVISVLGLQGPDEPEEATA